MYPLDFPAGNNYRYIPFIQADCVKVDRMLHVGPGVSSRDLKLNLGYHFDPPFSVQYPFGGICVGQDLWHQISKMFMDYLMLKWTYPLIQKTLPSGNESCAEGGIRRLICIDADLHRRAQFQDRIFKFREKHIWSVHDIG